MRILPLILLVACVTWQAAAQEEGEARAPPRGLLKRGPPTSKGKTTTTTTTLPPEEEEYVEESEEGEEQPEAATSAPAPSSTTEGKKIIGGGVRPFRSNADLLDLLKRKRAEISEAKSHGHTTTTTTIDPPADSFSKSNFNKKKPNGAPRDSNNDEVPAAKSSRGRFGKITRSIQEEPVDRDAVPARTRFYRRGN